jgi:hypothetical protein
LGEVTSSSSCVAIALTEKLKVPAFVCTATSPEKTPGLADVKLMGSA